MSRVSWLPSKGTIGTLVVITAGAAAAIAAVKYVAKQLDFSNDDLTLNIILTSNKVPQPLAEDTNQASHLPTKTGPIEEAQTDEFSLAVKETLVPVDPERMASTLAKLNNSQPLYLLPVENQEPILQQFSTVEPTVEPTVLEQETSIVEVMDSPPVKVLELDSTVADSPPVKVLEPDPSAVVPSARTNSPDYLYIFYDPQAASQADARWKRRKNKPKEDLLTSPTVSNNISLPQIPRYSLAPDQHFLPYTRCNGTCCFRERYSDLSLRQELLSVV